MAGIERGGGNEAPDLNVISMHLDRIATSNFLEDPANFSVSPENLHWLRQFLLVRYPSISAMQNGANYWRIEGEKEARKEVPVLSEGAILYQINARNFTLRRRKMYPICADQMERMIAYFRALGNHYNETQLAPTMQFGLVADPKSVEGKKTIDTFLERNDEDPRGVITYEPTDFLPPETTPEVRGEYREVMQYLMRFTGETLFQAYQSYVIPRYAAHLEYLPGWLTFWQNVLTTIDEKYPNTTNRKIAAERALVVGITSVLEEIPQVSGGAEEQRFHAQSYAQGTAPFDNREYQRPTLSRGLEARVATEQPVAFFPNAEGGYSHVAAIGRGVGMPGSEPQMGQRVTQEPPVGAAPSSAAPAWLQTATKDDGTGTLAVATTVAQLQEAAAKALPFSRPAAPIEVTAIPATTDDGTQTTNLSPEQVKAAVAAARAAVPQWLAPTAATPGIETQPAGLPDVAATVQGIGTIQGGHGAPAPLIPDGGDNPFVGTMELDPRALMDAVRDAGGVLPFPSLAPRPPEGPSETPEMKDLTALIQVCEALLSFYSKEFDGMEIRTRVQSVHAIFEAHYLDLLEEQLGEHSISSTKDRIGKSLDWLNELIAMAENKLPKDARVDLEGRKRTLLGFTTMPGAVTLNAEQKIIQTLYLRLQRIKETLFEKTKTKEGFASSVLGWISELTPVQTKVLSQPGGLGDKKDRVANLMAARAALRIGT